MIHPRSFSINITSRNAFAEISQRQMLLEAICDFPDLRPTHWSIEDVPENRMRRYGNTDEMMIRFRRGQCNRILRRDQDPMWFGLVSVDSAGLSDALFTFEPEPTTKWHPLLFHWADRLAEVYRAELGVAELVAPFRVAAYRSYNRPGLLEPYKYRLSGPAGFGARTYLGPRMVEFIGETYLRATGAVLTENNWGGLTVDLIENPWEAPLEQLIERHKQVMEVLAPSMSFGDYSQLVEDSGPRWAEYTARVKNLPPTDLPME